MGRRLSPAWGVLLAWLVVGTAQRGALLALVRQETASTTHDLLRVMSLGAQWDVAVALVLLLPFALWALICPERAWRSPTHRAAVMGAMAAAFAGMLAFVAIESAFFLAHRTRFGPGCRQRLQAMLDFALHARGGGPALLALVILLALTAIAWGLLHPLAERAFEGPRVPIGARLRDVALVAVLASGTLAQVAMRETEFPGRRTMRELSVNELVPIGRAAWWQAVRRGWVRHLPAAGTRPRDEERHPHRRVLQPAPREGHAAPRRRR